MRIKPERHEAFKTLFGNPLSVAIMIDIVKEGRYGRISLQEKKKNWNLLFGNKTKSQVLVFLDRLKKAKDYDYKVFKETFAKKIHTSL